MDYFSIIAKTRAYSGYFDFPLTRTEIHKWLITPTRVPYSRIESLLDTEISQQEIKKRKILSQISDDKITQAKAMVSLMKKIPGIYLIALTGSVSVGNSKREDDIDLLIVTGPNMLWIVRPIFLLGLSLLFRRRLPGDSKDKTADLFCPNLWIDSKHLSIPKRKRNLYTAHEVLQITPIYDRFNTYSDFIKENSWSGKYLANAYAQISSLRRKENRVKYSIRNKLFIPINLIFYGLQYLYMLPKKTTESISLHQAFFHTVDYNKALVQHLNSTEDI